MLNVIESNFAQNATDSDSSVRQNANARNNTRRCRQRVVGVERLKRCANTLIDCENVGFVAKKRVYCKDNDRHTTGIVQILSRTLQEMSACSTQQKHAHHFFKTLHYVEKRGKCLQSPTLLIRRSRVRISQFPPPSASDFTRVTAHDLLPSADRQRQ